MYGIFALPFLAQGVVMVADEFWFHHRRGLPRWERVGHPLDTLSVLGAFLYLALSEPTPASLRVYVGISIFSCLFITKDEWVHSRYCPPAEHWLHALLFVLHPCCLAAAGYLWWQAGLTPLHRMQITILATFFFYQTLYWNLPWKSRRAPPPSITTFITL